MTTTLSRSATFLLGFGLVFLPSYGPFVALLFFLAARWSLGKRDLWWWLAGLLLAIPLGLTEGLGGFAFGMAQVLAPWLVFRAFEQLPSLSYLRRDTTTISWGLVTGLALIVALSWLQIEQLNFTYKTLAQAIIWESNPALYGHTIMTIGALLAVLLPSIRLRLASLGLSALGILVSGSREAAIAWLIVAVALLFVRKQHASAASRWSLAALLVVMLAIAAGLGPLLGWGRVGFLVDVIPASSSAKNLIQGSEIAVGDWWDAMGVTVTADEVVLMGEPLTSYTVTKTGSESWLRLQQIVPLEPNQSYTVSTWLKPTGAGVRPGVQGWGELAGSNTVFTMTAALDGETLRTSLSGPGTLLGSGIAEQQDAWRRIWVTFRYEGDASPLYWYVGLAPDSREVAGTSARFAGFQLEPGETLSPYTPGSATRGLGLSVARLPYWQAAWQGFLAQPWQGWGQGAFPNFFRQNWPERIKLHEIPTHPHNLLLGILFERGLIGLLGLALLLLALSHSAWRQLDLALLIVFAAVFVANIFDYTLFYGGVLYPLAAVAGWRAATFRGATRQDEATVRQLAVRLGLIVSDYAVACLALLLAIGGASLVGFPVNRNEVAFPTAIFYVLLLWPLMAWREGLYPGYGLSAPQELKRQVTAAFVAGLVLLASALVFPTVLPLSTPVLLTTIALSMALGPFGRGVTKRLLLTAGLWGRSVIILGAGKTGCQLARVLQRHPLSGLHPVALFDDDPSKHDMVIDGLPVRGSLAEADSFARAEGIRHAIVAIPKVPGRILTTLTSTEGQAFERIQFVPDLQGLPPYAVTATMLNTTLALEVRNELHSRTNQLFKRSLDLFGAIVGGLLISPFLLVLAIAIYIDSPGPILFGHRRLGQGNKPFKVWKFRTMVPNAQALLNQYLASHPELRAEWEATHKLHNDPRVTRVGKLLRKYSLDELPQLWNVLVGEMSLVGPRPIVNDEVAKYGDAYALYSMVKPGMTGYWQVSGRSDTDYDERVALDSFYVRNWSVWLDLDILARTVMVVLRGKGAY